MADKPAETPERARMRAILPGFVQLSDDVLFDQVWDRPGLGPRDRSLITVAALVGMSRPQQMRGHLERALRNGVTVEELSEAITHLAFYAGWPAAASAAMILVEIVDARK